MILGMKKFLLYTSLLICSIAFAQQNTPKEAWLEKWENSKNYLVGIAEAMPEENYNFKPSERQMTFKEQLLHIKGNMDWLSTTYFTQTEYNKDNSEEIKTKAQTIAHLKKAFDAAYAIIENTSDKKLTETVDFFAGPKSKLQILNLLQDHVTHHRGQLIVYLNLKEVAPPKYSGW